MSIDLGFWEIEEKRCIFLLRFLVQVIFRYERKYLTTSHIAERRRINGKYNKQTNKLSPHSTHDSPRKCIRVIFRQSILLIKLIWKDKCSLSGTNHWKMLIIEKRALEICVAPNARMRTVFVLRRFQASHDSSCFEKWINQLIKCI